MSALAAPTPARAARFVQSCLWLLGVWKLAQALALWRQADWLTGLPLTPDPRLRLALAIVWAALFMAAALALRARIPRARALVPLLLGAYGVFALSMNLGFAAHTPAAWPALAYAAFICFACWTLWRPAARAFFHPSAPRPKEVADRRTL